MTSDSIISKMSEVFAQNGSPDKVADRQETQRANHDKRATRPLALLLPGQDIRVRDTQTDTWQPAKVATTDAHHAAVMQRYDPDGQRPST